MTLETTMIESRSGAGDTVTVNKQALAGWIIAQRRLFAKIDLSQIFGDDPDAEVVKLWDTASEWFTKFDDLVNVSLADCEQRGPTIWDTSLQPTEVGRFEVVAVTP